MIALDASLVIAHLDPGDAHHDAATPILLAAEAGSLLVHPLTLAEVLVGGVRIGCGVALRDDLRAAGIRTSPIDDDQPLRLAQLRVSTGLKLPDCCVLDVATQNRASLATFDAKLAAESRRRGLAVLP